MSNMLTFYDWVFANEAALQAGPGLFSKPHIIFMVLMGIWIIFASFLFHKYREAALKATTFLCYFMMISRLFRMLLLWISGTNTFFEILPWHLCHLMSFVFPIFFLTKTKKFFLPILAVTFFGGIITFVFGDYYRFQYFTFLDIESISLHFMMSTVVIACIASGYYKIKLKDSWQIPIMIGFLMAHATLGNIICKTTNFLYLKENGLPFNLFPGYTHIYTYFIVLLFLTFITYIPLLLIRYLKLRKKPKYEVIG